MALANRWVTTRQLGFLLGFMGSKVLGQYDLALLTAEATPGKLLFVEENIRATAAALDVPPGDPAAETSADRDVCTRLPRGTPGTSSSVSPTGGSAVTRADIAARSPRAARTRSRARC